MNKGPKTLEEKAEPIKQGSIKLLDFWPHILLGSVPIISLFVTIFPDANFKFFNWDISIPYALTGLTFVFAICGGVGMYFRTQSLHAAQQRCKELEKDLHQARSLAKNYQSDVQSALKFALQQLAFDIGLSRDVGSSRSLHFELRITLYCHHPKRNTFIPIVRIAGDPTLEKFGRSEYPDSQGAISQGWKTGGVVLTSLPEDRAIWELELVENYGFSPDEASSIAMQSLSMLATRLNAESGPIGVIVVESTKKRGVSAKTMDVLRESTWYAPIASLMVSVQESLVPHISKD